MTSKKKGWTNGMGARDSSGRDAAEWADGYALGKGVSTLTGATRGDALTYTGQGEKRPAGGGAGDITIALATSAQEFYSFLGIQAQVSASYGLSSVSVKTEFTKEFTANSFSSWVVVRVALEKSVEQLTAANQAALSPGALGTLSGAEGSQRFFETYGDSYVTAIISGGEFLAVLQVDAASEEARQELKTSWDANVGVGKTSVSSSGSVDQVTKTLSSTSHKSFVCRTYPPMAGPTALTIDAVVEFALAFGGKVTSENATPLRVLLEDYGTLNPPEPARTNLGWQKLKNAKTLLDGIDKFLANLLPKREIARKVANLPACYRPDVRAPFASNLTVLEAQVNDLFALAEGCCDSFPNADPPALPAPPTCCDLQISEPPVDRSLRTDDVIFLKAPHEQGYLKQVGRGDRTTLETGGAPDESSEFAVRIRGEGVVALMMSGGGYLQRINRGGDLNPIELVSNDGRSVYNQFRYIYNDDHTLSFVSDNDMYLSVIERNGIYAIEAAKHGIDDWGKFQRVLVRFAGGGQDVALAAALGV